MHSQEITAQQDSKILLICVTFMAKFIIFSHSQNSCQILIEGFNAIQSVLLEYV